MIDSLILGFKVVQFSLPVLSFSASSGVPT